MMEHVGNSLPEVITTILQQWRSLSKPRQRDLLRVCTKKYGELERVHENFLAILNELYALILDAMVQDRSIDEKFVKEVWAFEERRREGRPARLAAYVEAQVYAEAKPARIAGVIRKIPRPVEEAVKKFMRSYTGYFEHDKMYNHEVARAVQEVAHTISHVVRSGSTIATDPDVSRSLRFIGNLRDGIELSWMNVSRDYYRLYATFADHGIVLE